MSTICCVLADAVYDKDEMFHPSADYSQSRPFKIFISLLDKWEVGSPLTEVLIFDAFKALKKAVDRSADRNDDVGNNQLCLACSNHFEC